MFKLLGKKNSSTLCAFIFYKIGKYSKFNRIAKKNISFVWPKKNTEDVNKIIKGMWRNIGRNFGEFIHLKKYNPINCTNTKIVGLKNIKKIIAYNNKKKKGIIFFSAHYGNWEVGPLVLKSLQLDPLCLYRRANNKFVDFIIQKIRSAYGTYAPKGDLGAKKSFIWLIKGNCLALLMDQKLNEGPMINFLGKPAPTANFIADLALKMDLDIVPIRLSRVNKFDNNIKFFNKIVIPKGNLSHNKRVKIVLKEINSVISDWIKNNPEQWLWIHRRWNKNLY